MVERANFHGSDETIDITPATYNVLETVDFLTDQLREIQTAKDRVWIQTMALEAGHFSNLLARHLIAAAKRGVDVKVVYDAYSDYVVDNTFTQMPLLKSKDRSHRSFVRDEQKKLLDSLREDCYVSETNRPSRFASHVPFSVIFGRDHKKISIIDNKVYIGGVNMAPLDAQRVDFVLKTNNKQLLDRLSIIFEKSFLGIPESDSIYVCDANNTLLLDSGKRRQSIIMEQVYDAVRKEDKKVTLVSPFLPSGNLRKVLNKAVQRGIEVEVITSQEDQLGLTPRMSQKIRTLGQSMPLFKINRYPGVIHAKAVLFGKRAAIIGSHNFDELFVILGTEEVSLLTTQPEVIMQLTQFCENIRNVR